MILLPELWYHGSPKCCFENIEDFEDSIMFLTDSHIVALEYLKTLPSSGTSRKGRPSPTLYELDLKIGSDEIFDTRRPDHMELFVKLAKASRQALGEDGFSKSDLIRVHRAPKSSLEGIFPSFGTVRTLLPMLTGLGFKAVLAGEGVQGASLAVYDPQKNVRIRKIVRSDQ